ncbi:MAG: hypothetical protein EB143_05490, partial [Actinobacteria bacterium]|nr:hypothetical protein [Actinomycetota bacterium]
GATTINSSGGNITISGSGSLGTSASYSGAIAITSATSTFTYASSTSQTLSGAISGAGALVKSGTSGLTLDGTSTFTGTTTVSGGTLTVSSAGALGASGASQGTTVDSGAALYVQAAVTVPEPLTISGTGRALSGAIFFGSAGTLSGAVTMAADSTIQVGYTAGTISGAISGAFGLTKTGQGSLTLSGANTFSGALTISDGTVSVGAGSTTGSIATTSVVVSGTLDFNRSDGVTYSGVISGSGSLTQSGGGTLTLTGTNTYSGGTTISSGTLSVGAGSNAGVIAGNVTNNATLVFDRSDAVTFAGAISGTGAVTKSGTNTLTLTSNGTYSGATTVSGGALVLQNNAPSTSSSGFGGAGTLTIEPAATSFSSAWSTSGFSFGGTLTGLTLGKSGNNVDVTVATTASITGPVVVYAKDITVGAAITATSSNVSLNATGAVTQSAAITGSGLAMIGTGSFTLTNTSNNVSTIAAGTSSARAASISYRDSNTVTIGSVNPTGIWSSGDVLIETATGDLTFSESINTTSGSSTAVTLNAGRDASAGTSTGGNIIVSGSPTITMGSGGIARLFSGSVDSSTNLTTFIGSGTGQFRYNSDETDANYALTLSADKQYAIYRERPTLTVTASAQSLAYGTLIAQSFTVSGKNGDTAAHAFSTDTAAILVNSLALFGVESGDVVSLNPVLAFNDRNVGTGKAVNITSSSTLGGGQSGSYSLSLSGAPATTANVTAKALSVSGLSSANKVYDGTTTASVSGTAALLSAVAAEFGSSSTDGKPYSVDSVSVTGTPAAAFNSKDVASATTVSFTGLSLTGTGNGNYTLTAHATE